MIYIGADYHPEHWVYPYSGTPEEKEARWEKDAQLMVEAGINAVRMGEFSWGLCEPQEGKFDFEWLRRAMNIMQAHGIKVVLCTPTAAPPLWLSKKHPEILPVDACGLRLYSGTRRAYCMNSDIYWEYCKKIVTAMAEALGNHPQLIAWQIDNGLGAHNTECSFNEETKKDWQLWLKAKYETIENLNEKLGSRFWSQIFSDWSDVPMPLRAPANHNPSLLLDWLRFCTDTIVAFIKMQADILRSITPNIPVTTNLRMFERNFDYYDIAEAIDFVGIDSYATMKSRAAENACEIDMARSLKKSGIKQPNSNSGFWVIEQKPGNVTWQDVNSTTRPGIVRLFTYQAISRGANAVFYFYWRPPRFGSELFYGGVLTHTGRGDNRIYKEIQQIGKKMKLFGDSIDNTRVVAEAGILFNHLSFCSQKLKPQRNIYFNNREHIQLFHTALHDRNILVDFISTSDDLSKYKIIFAPSLRVLSYLEAQVLKNYVENGGTLVATFDTGTVDEQYIAPIDGIPLGMTDLFGLEVEESDMLPPQDETNHLSFKGSFTTTHIHPAKIWCDIITPKGCQTLATYSKDFYAGLPAMTMNYYGKGHAIYIGTMSDQTFYYDLIAWLRQMCGLFPLLKVPETIEVCLREGNGVRLYFLLNHQNSPVRLTFLKPVHDFLSGRIISGNYDLQPHDVLVVDQRAE